MNITLTQSPPGGGRILKFRGDAAEFVLRVSPPAPGRAFLRTNAGHAHIHRREIIKQVEDGRAPACQDWEDIPMRRTGAGEYRVDIALIGVGHFEAKCCFVTDGAVEPYWPSGDNVSINVEPPDYCCGNSVYCAFPRQFGPDMSLPERRPPEEVGGAAVAELDGAGYTLIPPSGTFRALKAKIPFIIDRLKCRIIHLLPINPTPTTFARMGRFGSPYASLDFTAIDPALAEFDRKATPLDQFLELVDAIHGEDGRLILDIAINHTGWAAKIHEEHPEWLVREADGSIHSPGAWGNTWADLTELDHHRFELWAYLAEVFLTWCSRGVDGFRCDAGYMIPLPAWRYIIAKVRLSYPDTLFLLEGLGGDPAVTIDLLNRGNMNWAYSELFQNYSKSDIENYVSRSKSIGRSDGVMIHYAETHDNNRLAAESAVYAKMRVALSALLSDRGAFGITNGVEWFAKEKIDVHESSALNWGAEENQVEAISRLNSLLAVHPAFYPDAVVEFVESGHPAVIAATRFRPGEGRAVLALINTDCVKPVVAKVPSTVWPSGHDGVFDLLTGERMTASPDTGFVLQRLAAGAAMCLDGDMKNLASVEQACNHDYRRPLREARQRALAMALDVICEAGGCIALDDGFDADAILDDFTTDPAGFCRRALEDIPGRGVVHWKWPYDLGRTVMLPPGHFLLVRAPRRFRASLVADGVTNFVHHSVQAADGSRFVVFKPLPTPDKPTSLQLVGEAFSNGQSHRGSAPLLLLPAGEPTVPAKLEGTAVTDPDGVFLATNDRGGMCRPRVAFGTLRSKYDCLLGANVNPCHPEDRHIAWTRCRAALIYQGRREGLTPEKIQSFETHADGSGSWLFHLPVGKGRFVDITATVSMADSANAVRIEFERLASGDEASAVLRVWVDVEDRNFHAETKASSGPEGVWEKACLAGDGRIEFAPSPERRLVIVADKGIFISEPNWIYNVYHEIEAERGLEANGDLFCPGYFDLSLDDGDSARLDGGLETPADPVFDPVVNHPRLDIDAGQGGESADFAGFLTNALKRYIVKRDGLKTVIAGYPWFLDWGRDTLICARGMIAADMIGDTLAIVNNFARFAENGTLPNIIHGDSVGNRDTSDAPLWLFVAAADLREKLGDDAFLHEEVAPNRTLLQSLVSIAEGYIAGTPNGIKVDTESGLVFSPSHFTWMDTNYPAGTPRQGYPVEIQALWIAALDLLTAITNDPSWRGTRGLAAESLRQLFVRPEGWLSDCLHCPPGTPAAKAIADDHLRPNQLFSVTLGAIEDRATAEAIIDACSELVVPGAIRSLSARPVSYNLPIETGGTLINNPARPYWGRYEGDEDSRRKPAYHNGTAWTWPFPSYCEAMLMVRGKSARAPVEALLAASESIIRKGCFGQVPEILDGDFPHRQRGCDAQAWGVSELLRVWIKSRETD